MTGTTTTTSTEFFFGLTHVEASLRDGLIMVFIVIGLCTPSDPILDIQWLYDRVLILGDNKQLQYIDYCRTI